MKKQTIINVLNMDIKQIENEQKKRIKYINDIIKHTEISNDTKNILKLLIDDYTKIELTEPYKKAILELTKE